ncbi:hypothetical protein B0H10DRAFT_1957523 [Mycena sp. CBHHK59/15]|nr:hypothetical protein B0H10DRAFT_1957523 [Mycena sp. CBHHK59/15]
MSDASDCSDDDLHDRKIIERLGSSNLRWMGSHSTVLVGLTPTVPLSGTPSVFLTITVFFGLPAVLWAYKCLMLALFQRKIIYMGYVPPGSKQEELTKNVHPTLLNEISCQEVRIVSETGTLYGIAVSPVDSYVDGQPDVVIVYLQGNAGNPLHRLPVFHKLLTSPNRTSNLRHGHGLKVIAVAPRSYWKSTPSCPTQRGIMADYKTDIHHTLSTFPHSQIVLYAPQALRRATRESKVWYSRTPSPRFHAWCARYTPSDGCRIITLRPLAWDKWDAAQALSSSAGDFALARLAPNMLVLLSEHDEVVPNEMGEELCAIGNSRGDGTMGGRVVIPAALHDNAHVQWVWRSEMQRYIADVERLSKSDVA